jgi:two-component system chemotaxis response regulator CheY
MGKRILVVDDSVMMRKMIVKTLGDAGHEIVGEAANGEQAVEMYGRVQPDIVTMDITMRGMDGLAAAREIKKGAPQAQIIFLSNLNEDKYGAEVEAVGGIGLVNKHKAAEVLEMVEGT